MGQKYDIRLEISDRICKISYFAVESWEKCDRTRYDIYNKTACVYADRCR